MFSALACCLLALGAFAAPLTLSAPDAHRMSVAGEIVLIDIRTPQEWRLTGVPQGAEKISWHPGETQRFAEEILRLAGGDRDAPIALICRTGNRSTQAQDLLVREGFTRVYNVTEGTAGSAGEPGWLKRGLPVDRFD